MWNHRRSMLLSKLFVLLFMGGLLAVLLTAPFLVSWLARFSINIHVADKLLFLLTLYTGGAVAAVLLVCLYKLLHQIGLGELFTRTNVSLMRLISWCCFVGVGIALLSGLYYMPWLVVAVAAAFMGLIVRVVKNLVDEAVLLKEENDFTI